MQSALKIPFAGWRSGNPVFGGSFGHYWSSSPFNTKASYLFFGSGFINPLNTSGDRPFGFSVRCFKK